MMDSAFLVFVLHIYQGSVQFVYIEGQDLKLVLDTADGNTGFVPASNFSFFF